MKGAGTAITPDMKMYFYDKPRWQKESLIGLDHNFSHIALRSAVKTYSEHARLGMIP